MIRRRAMRRTPLVPLLALLVAMVAPPVAANQVSYPDFADPAFQRTWERYDRPVYYGSARRSYTWGASISPKLEEPFREGPDGKHVVQYYEKSRMEINDPSGNQNDPFFVTQGLLAFEMIRGEIQEGVSTFRQVEPAQIPFGDLDDVGEASPTYASFGRVLDQPPVPRGEPITQAINRAGTVIRAPRSYDVTSAGVMRDVVTNHSIASVFLEFLQQSGVVYVDGQDRTETLYNPLFYVTGQPITEAYWSQVRITTERGARVEDVLIQCFERRCLTYRPSNPAEFRVELANTGLQYYKWRYPLECRPSPGPNADTPGLRCTHGQGALTVEVPPQGRPVRVDSGPLPRQTDLPGARPNYYTPRRVVGRFDVVDVESGQPLTDFSRAPITVLVPFTADEYNRAGGKLKLAYWTGDQKAQWTVIGKDDDNTLALEFDKESVNTRGGVGRATIRAWRPLTEGAPVDPQKWADPFLAWGE